MKRNASKEKYATQHALLDDRYLDLKAQGFKDIQIYTALKVSKISFLRWKQRNGLINPRPCKLKNFSKEDYESLLESGFTDHDICKAKNVDRKTLYLWRRRHGLEIRKHYPATPKKLPSECLEAIERLYPMLEKIRVADVKSLATERLIRSAWIFHCKAQEGNPLSHEMQRRYFSRIIGFCVVTFQNEKRNVMERYDRVA